MKKQMSDSLLLAIFLTLAGGFQDAYSYNCRGQVFANAQTGNIVLFGQNLATGQWTRAFHYLLPVLSFVIGVYLTEWIRHHHKYSTRIHWRQTVLLGELLLLLIVGFLPNTMDIPANILLSFACAMQVNTFRKIYEATRRLSMCIGNMLSVAYPFSAYHVTHDPALRQKSRHYYFVIGVFAVGAAFGAVLSQRLGNRAIWIAASLQLIGFFLMFCPRTPQTAEETAV